VSERLGEGSLVLRAGKSIRFASFDDIVILLDLDSEEYFALDEFASHFWQLLFAHSGDTKATADNLSSGQRKAFEEFVRECIERRILVATFASSDSVKSKYSVGMRVPLGRRMSAILGARAWWYLMSTWFMLRRRSFGPLYLELTADSAVSECATIDSVPQAVAAFIWAENLFWYRDAPNDCLPRSLALYRFMRSLDLPVTHKIGGKRFPGLLIHAWVESEGVPLVDDPDLLSTFTVLSTIP
jgi:hypothetical protein